jgi:peptidoglycan endopeptidase LytF
MIKKIFLLSAFIGFSSVSAQKTHTVIKDDTAYNISKKYGISLAELAMLNPKTQDGKLTLGDVLVVQSSGKNTAKEAPKSTLVSSGNSAVSLGKIILQPKQTVYGITKQYQISEADLRKLNPGLEDHMKIGDEIILPLAQIKKFGGEQIAAPELFTAKEEKQAPVIAAERKGVANDAYEIQAKDNYYKLSRKFNISQTELFALNPGLEAKGLQPGAAIKVKSDNEIGKEEVKAVPASTKTPSTYTSTSVADDYVNYTVQQGDTVFGILNRFKVSLDDLLTLNPQLSEGLKVGQTLKLKKVETAYSKKSGDALNVVLMLPFGFDSDDSKYRALALDFLSGAKLAIERNVKRGQKLDVKVVDAGNAESFKSSLSQINRDNTALIVGPFFKTGVLQVLDYVKASKIPVVAPFANSEDLMKFDNLILVETKDEVYADRIAKEVKEVYSDQKIYIVTDENLSKANYLKAQLEKDLKKPTVLLVKSASEIKTDQNMMTGKAAPVIAILLNDDDAVGEAFANRLIALSKEAENIKSFSMHYAPVFGKKVDELSQANLVYLMDRKVNTEGDFEKEILADYKKKYCKTPSKYSVIGFDVVNDMLSRENEKGEIFKQMNKVQTQLATKFEFEKSKTGAYINKGYRVVRLVPN